MKPKPMTGRRRWMAGAALFAAIAMAGACYDQGPTAVERPDPIPQPITYQSAGRIFATDTTGTEEVVLIDDQSTRLVLRAFWSPTGEYLLTRERGRDPGDRFEVAVRAADGSGMLRVSADGLEPDSEPVWSPDGTRVAYTDLQLYVVDRDGTDHVAVNADGSFARNPHWSPAGGWIVYYGDVDGRLGIVRVRPDGVDRQLLREVGGGADQQYPRYSPDGRRIAFVESNDIWVMDADGTDVTQLTFTPSEGDWWPRWSPDGRLIAHNTDAGSDWGVAVLDVRAATRTDLFGDGTFEIVRPVWAADSRRLVFDVEHGIGIGILGQADAWVGAGPGSYPDWHPGA